MPPLDKTANVAFINMEGGGLAKPQVKPNVAPTPKPAAPVQPAPAKPAQPQPTTKPQAAVAPTKPQHTVTPVPLHPTPATKPLSTPGPGSVKQLVNFYDSQGKGSVIRPYSYAEAVKKNKN